MPSLENRVVRIIAKSPKHAKMSVLRIYGVSIDLYYPRVGFDYTTYRYIRFLPNGYDECSIDYLDETNSIETILVHSFTSAAGLV